MGRGYRDRLNPRKHFSLSLPSCAQQEINDNKRPFLSHTCNRRRACQTRETVGFRGAADTFGLSTTRQKTPAQLCFLSPLPTDELACLSAATEGRCECAGLGTRSERKQSGSCIHKTCLVLHVSRRTFP